MPKYCPTSESTPASPATPYFPAAALDSPALPENGDDDGGGGGGDDMVMMTLLMMVARRIMIPDSVFDASAAQPHPLLLDSRLLLKRVEEGSRFFRIGLLIELGNVVSESYSLQRAKLLRIIVPAKMLLSLWLALVLQL